MLVLVLVLELAWYRRNGGRAMMGMEGKTDSHPRARQSDTHSLTRSLTQTDRQVTSDHFSAPAVKTILFSFILSFFLSCFVCFDVVRFFDSNGWVGGCMYLWVRFVVQGKR